MGDGNRIPAALRAIFVASNQGGEVHKPPEDTTASKVFIHEISVPTKKAPGARKKERKVSFSLQLKVHSIPKVNPIRRKVSDAAPFL